MLRGGEKWWKGRGERRGERDERVKVGKEGGKGWKEREVGGKEEREIRMEILNWKGGKGGRKGIMEAGRQEKKKKR